MTRDQWLNGWRGFALLAAAVPVLFWPFFVLAGVMTPEGGWGKEPVFALFVYFTVAYPLLFGAALWLSLSSRFRSRKVSVFIALAPLILLGLIATASGAAADLIKASGHG
jgi:carbon starvation protein CstA